MRNWFKFLSRWRRPSKSEEEEIVTRLFGGTADWKSMDLVVQRDALQAEVNRLSKKVEELP
jgi:hypothetical protein